MCLPIFSQETYGEDPYLTGQLAQQYVYGLQGTHEGPGNIEQAKKSPRYITANAGCKHFDVHAGPENIPISRLSFDAKVRMEFLDMFSIMREYSLPGSI